MDERRKTQRVSMNSSLSIETLFKSGQSESIKKDFNITISDISKTGMGFITQEILPLDHYFNARVSIDDKRSFFCVLRVVRKDQKDTEYHYGSEFVGLAEILGNYIDDFVSESSSKE